MRKNSTVCVVCFNQRPGSANPNWKGGIIRHKAGYVMVRSLGHPRARANSGYVFEHILVMEKVLGRHLLRQETVHHRNGVRDDNRASNLELWSTSHPSGTRAVDAVAWATEILNRYGGWDIVAFPLPLEGGLDLAGNDPASETASRETSTSLDRI